VIDLCDANVMSHDPSEFLLICWFSAQETTTITINAENRLIL